VIGGNTDKISLVGNGAENGLIYPYSIGRSVTNLTMLGNRGGGAGFTSINLVPGASLDADHATGFPIGSDNGRKIGFWGNTPVSQPAAPPADATDLATAIAPVNDLKAKLKRIGLTA
jgi:hypothetical protein